MDQPTHLPEFQLGMNGKFKKLVLRFHFFECFFSINARTKLLFFEGDFIKLSPK